MSGHDVEKAAPDWPRCSIMLGFDWQAMDCTTAAVVGTCALCVDATALVVVLAGASVGMSLVELPIETLVVVSTSLFVELASHPVDVVVVAPAVEDVEVAGLELVEDMAVVDSVVEVVVVVSVLVVVDVNVVVTVVVVEVVGAAVVAVEVVGAEVLVAGTAPSLQR